MFRNNSKIESNNYVHYLTHTVTSRLWKVLCEHEFNIKRKFVFLINITNSKYAYIKYVNDSE